MAMSARLARPVMDSECRAQMSCPCLVHGFNAGGGIPGFGSCLSTATPMRSIFLSFGRYSRRGPLQASPVPRMRKQFPLRMPSDHLTVEVDWVELAIVHTGRCPKARLGKREPDWMSDRIRECWSNRENRIGIAGRARILKLLETCTV